MHSMKNSIVTTLKCPECNSDNVSRPQYSRRVFAVSFLLLGFPIPFFKKESHCFECGTNFKVRKTKAEDRD